MEKHEAREFDCAHCGEPIAAETLEPGVAVMCDHCGRRSVVPEQDMRTEKERETEFEKELTIVFDRWFPKLVSAGLISAFSIYLTALEHREIPLATLNAIVSSDIFQRITGICVFASGIAAIIIGFALFVGGALREGFKFIPTMTMTVLFAQCSDRNIDPLIVKTFKTVVFFVLGIELVLFMLRLTS